MPQPLSDVIRRTRSLLEEVGTSPRFWTDTELTDWINDGCRDMARRAEDLLTFDTTITTVAGTEKYTLPDDVIRIHRAEFVPVGQLQRYPIAPKTHQEMDTIWGIYQTNPSSYPSFFVVWGYSGGKTRNLHQIQLYPVPATGGTLNLFYYRMPYRFLDPLANPGELVKDVEVVEGWDDAVVRYATYNAMLKDRDEMWQTIKAEYEQMMEYLVNVTRQAHDQEQTMTSTGGMGAMSWLYSFDG